MATWPLPPLPGRFFFCPYKSRVFNKSHPLKPAYGLHYFYMKKWLLLLTSSILLYWPTMTFAFRVIIDPGHGGRDHGATYKNLRESKITLQVSKKLANYLNKDPRFKAFLTRTRDSFVSLSKRAQIATQLKGDLFLSIHVNASQEKAAKGGEIYFQNQLPADEESMFLASIENNGLQHGQHLPLVPLPSSLKPDVQNIIQDLYRTSRLFLSAELAKSIFKTWKGSRKSTKYTIHQAPFYVISHVPMPSVLIELGFLSNPKEAKKLSKTSYQTKLAQGLYEGIVNFKEVMDSSQKKQYITSNANPKKTQ
ncbi:MAG: N-acetylmuramoyl-L-alanine amidase [Bdellovibrio sp.]|nr:MAG: N-acetylmuramoyl-L-alanine amidase [Bdellovibrio sp.]